MTYPKMESGMNVTSTVNEKAQILSVDVARIDAAVAIEFKDKMREETASGEPRSD